MVIAKGWYVGKGDCEEKRGWFEGTVISHCGFSHGYRTENICQKSLNGTLKLVTLLCANCTSVKMSKPRNILHRKK